MNWFFCYAILQHWDLSLNVYQDKTVHSQTNPSDLFIYVISLTVMLENTLLTTIVRVKTQTLENSQSKHKCVTMETHTCPWAASFSSFSLSTMALSPEPGVVVVFWLLIMLALDWDSESLVCSLLTLSRRSEVSFSSFSLLDLYAISLDFSLSKLLIWKPEYTLIAQSPQVSA